MRGWNGATGTCATWPARRPTLRSWMRRPGRGATSTSTRSSSATTPRGGVLAERPDFGTMGLALLGRQDGDAAAAALPKPTTRRACSTSTPPAATTPSAPLDGRLRGGLGRRWKLEPGKEATATFVVTWHFPNLRLPGFAKPVGRWYATRFADAAAVAEYVADNFDRLSKQTRLWRDTWYDSTLPYWLLDRLFTNASILATSTCHRFADGRFYGWEGVGCCVGTCTHVWHYAHAAGPALPGAGAVGPRDAGLRHGLGGLRPGPLPRRDGRRHVRHRRPGRRGAALLPRTPDVGRTTPSSSATGRRSRRRWSTSSATTRTTTASSRTPSRTRWTPPITAPIRR